MEKEGMSDNFLNGIDWATFDMGQVTQGVWDHIEKLLMKFFQAHTKEELYKEALRLNIMIYPVSTPEDIAENEQLKDREYWVQVEHPELEETITYPNVPVKAGETPIRIRRRAPLIGEHNKEVYEELGLSKEDLAILKQAGVI
jgi:crotonobetainyl-CoA:carnitine CoA-transferase CaiB-like acyl-CoA transferase